MKGKIISLLIFIAIFLVCLICKTYGQAKQYQITHRCEYGVENCKAIKGIAAITVAKVHIVVENIPAHFKIVRVFRDRQNIFCRWKTFYELSGLNYSGFFIVDRDSAVLDIHIHGRGYYTAWYKFKEK